MSEKKERNKQLEEKYNYNYSSYNFDEKDKSGKWLSYVKMLRQSEYNLVILFVGIISVIAIGWIGIEIYQMLNSSEVNSLKDGLNVGVPTSSEVDLENKGGQ